MSPAFADYGMAVFALAAVAWVLVSVLAKRRPEAASGAPGTAELAKIVTDNTQAMTRLTVLIETQGALLQRVLERLDDLWDRR